ncbi:MAG TPA: cytochrome c [Tepidisphaeraceae bacterium]|jgi:mono/diheme cytochrome c family protein
MRLPVVLPLLLTVVAGCKDPENDMALQPRYEPYRKAEMFADHASARPLVAGTVARDPARVPSRAWAARVSNPEVMATELAPAGGKIPFPITREVIEHGQQGFDIYCSVCHGRLGNGDGMVVQRGFVRPPSFHVERLITAPDSHFFDVISNGFGAMYPYGDRVPPQLRWEIVAYVRALQTAPEVAGARLTAADRQALVAYGDRPAPAPIRPASTGPATRPKEVRP